MTGQAAAREEVDPIAHTGEFAGAVAGALVGVAMGALLLATGPVGALALAAVLSAGLGATATMSGVFRSLMSGLTFEAGNLEHPVSRILINDRRSINAIVSTADCDGTIPLPCMGHGLERVATGSDTVHFEGKPAARHNDRIECGAFIARGSDNVFIGGGVDSEQLAVRKEVPDWFEYTMIAVEWAGLALGVASFAGLAVVKKMAARQIMKEIGKSAATGVAKEGSKWTAEKAIAEWDPELAKLVGPTLDGMFEMGGWGQSMFKALPRPTYTGTTHFTRTDSRLPAEWHVPVIVTDGEFIWPETIVIPAEVRIRTWHSESSERFFWSSGSFDADFPDPFSFYDAWENTKKAFSDEDL